MGVEISLTLRSGGRLSVLEKRMARMIFEPKKDDMTEEWRGLFQEELCDLYS